MTFDDKMTLEDKEKEISQLNEKLEQLKLKNIDLFRQLNYEKTEKHTFEQNRTQLLEKMRNEYEEKLIAAKTTRNQKSEDNKKLISELKLIGETNLLKDTLISQLETKLGQKDNDLERMNKKYSRAKDEIQKQKSMAKNEISCKNKVLMTLENRLNLLESQMQDKEG